MLTSQDLLDLFARDRARLSPNAIDLTLRPAYLELLARLGHPERRLPPVFHVAGTNGKGSVSAFLRAMLEAAGRRVHVYTSPHLIRFHERIRVAGQLIGEDELVGILEECRKLAEPGMITLFEVATAAALTAFARHPADAAILEVGLGGRLDATNVIEEPLATLITRLSFDHRDYLGETLASIASEKAGIMRKDVPCFTVAQPPEALAVLREAATTCGAPLFVGEGVQGSGFRVQGECLFPNPDWTVTPASDGFRYADAEGALDLPLPALVGAHQLENAGLAIAVLRLGGRGTGNRDSPPVPCPLSPRHIAQGLQTVQWPARLQKLTGGALSNSLPESWELWLDGGHNDSAGAALAQQAQVWRIQDALPRPLYLVCGMLLSKNPREFLAPLVPHVAGLQAVPIPNEASFTGMALSEAAHAAGIAHAVASVDLKESLRMIAGTSPAPGRILICGSLYLAGQLLKEEGFRV